MLFSATVLVEKFSKRKRSLFLKVSLFFCVTMKFVRNLLTVTSKWGAGEEYVPLKAQMAYFFKICEAFLSKKRCTEIPN